jgi:hypothetical protein
MFASIIAVNEALPVLLMSGYTVHRVPLESVIQKVEVTLKRNKTSPTEGSAGAGQSSVDAQHNHQEGEQHPTGREGGAGQLVAVENAPPVPLKRFLCVGFYDHEKIALQPLPAL